MHQQIRKAASARTVAGNVMVPPLFGRHALTCIDRNMNDHHPEHMSTSFAAR
jgi:hypothetical protein